MCVLLVEDDTLIREIMCEILEDAGYDVLPAEDGRTALGVLEHPPRHFTALLTDFHMPGDVTGIEVARRARAAFPGIPVIIASGRPDVLDESWASEDGFRLLPKPYLPSELLAAVQALIGGH